MAVKGFPREIFLDFRGATADTYSCGYCKDILRRAQQRPCGHSFCYECLEKLKRQSAAASSEPVVCPTCTSIDDVIEESVISRDEVASDDYAKSRVLAKKNVKCPYEGQGCHYMGTLRDYESNHESSCEYALTECDNGCGETVHITKVNDHLTLHCPLRQVTCSYCKKVYVAIDENEHIQACPTRPAECDWCGKKNLNRDELIHHKDTECEYFFCSLGCNMKILREEISSHYRDLHCAKKHMVFINKKFEELKTTLEKLINTAKQNQNEDMRAEDERVTNLIDQFECMEDQVKHLDNLCSVFKVEFEKIFDSAIFNKSKTDQLGQTLQQLQERLQRLEQGVQIRDVQLMERDLRLKAMEDISYDGSLIWRIENFSECRRKAQNGEMTSIYSPAFYTSRCGYKMCARLYLNGDGIGKGTHVSFFFVMMKGKYDGLLRWPFQQKVTMMLMDYTCQYHIMDAFRPDSGSASFHKPKTEMNVASGCPLFMPLSALEEKLHNHVRDDVAYFKIIVDCSDIPY